MKELLCEPTAPRSPYDEKFVYREDAITLKSSDLQLNRITFTYQLNDVEEHEGRFEVECNHEGDGWEISRAESIYYYAQNPFCDSSYQQTEDVLLSHKVESIVRYIESKEEPRVELYRVKIDGDKVVIDANNIENENMQGEWREVLFSSLEYLGFEICEKVQFPPKKILAARFEYWDIV